jgi:hypothetical protein
MSDRIDFEGKCFNCGESVYTENHGGLSFGEKNIVSCNKKRCLIKFSTITN